MQKEKKMSILDELYYEWHEPREKPRSEEQEKWGYIETLWARAEESLDADLLQELQMNIFQLLDQEACHEFQEGFRLGAQLMLSIRSPAAAASPELWDQLPHL